MEVADILLADYATINDRGKFTLVGAGFTEIASKSMPCIHPLIFVLIRLRVGVSDGGKHKIGLQIVGEKGAIFKADMNVNIPQIKYGQKIIPLTARIVNLKFENAGIYNIDVSVNEKVDQSYNLTINHITNVESKN